jgi:CBS domain-containing protein
MHTSIECVGPNDSIRQVVESMVENKLRSMPVVDGEKMVGIISRGDAIRYLVFEEE